MRTEFRFILAVGLMFLVLIGTNLLFPPVIPEVDTTADSLAAGAADGSGAAPDVDGGATDPAVPGIGVTPTVDAGAVDAPAPTASDPATAVVAAPERVVTVEGPLYRFEFSTVGARLTSAVMPGFQDLHQEGIVDLVPAGAGGLLSQRLVVGADTVDLSRAAFRVEPEEGLTLSEGGGRQSLAFVYEHPTQPFTFEIEYTFDPDLYLVAARGRTNVGRSLLLSELGEGLPFVEADSAQEARMMAYVYNHVNDGIDSEVLDGAEPMLVPGPLLYAAFKSKFFAVAMLAGESEESLTEADYLNGLIVTESELPERIRVDVAQSIGNDGVFNYRVFMGPQVYNRLSSLGQGMEEVNPYGWRFFRPIVRPFVSIIMTILTFLHENLNIAYGWVLMVFGVGMRIVLFPLNHKAMRAQLRNMQFQPLVAEAQKKYKDNPEKLQKEMLRLHKEGFNPLAGCLPMLIPYPVLIALFFVFQYTIELRGQAFWWLTDLSAKDPYYILPVMMAVSMFLMQWVMMRSMEQPNPQMKMMMYFMPAFMLFLFSQFPSGLNLYYATVNVATIPQQIWIAGERKKMKGKPPPKLSED